VEPWAARQAWKGQQQADLGHDDAPTSRPTRVEAERGFEELVRRNTSRLRRFAFLLTGNWHDAEDLLQNAFLNAYRSAERLCRVECPDAYLRQIVVHAYIDQVRKRRVSEYVTDTVPEFAAQKDDNDEKWVVRAALARVPRSQREILVLRFYADMSVQQTAATLGCSTGNVKSQTSRGLAALERHLQDLAAAAAR
jgi:RNA polymerase sigma-70 factor (sigma-E family)